MHCVTASLVPDIVTVRSVEFGSISEATCIEAPVTSRISLIFEPPFPINDPHWEAGTINRRVIGGLGTPPPPPPPPAPLPWISWNCEHHSSNFLQISVKALNIEFVGPVTVTIRSGHEPSEIFIFAPDCLEKKINQSINQSSLERKFNREVILSIVNENWKFVFLKLTSSRNLFTISPFFPIMLPTSWKSLKKKKKKGKANLV